MKINIIGRGEGWEAGYETPGDKWAINYWNPKADVLFDLHDDCETDPYSKRELDNARAFDTPIITHKDFPFELFCKFYGTDYFGSSVDWLIAHAIRQLEFHSMHPVREIHLYGITMDDKGDHYEKRCATDFWCGVAIGRGVKIIVHGNSTVMTTVDGLQYGTLRPMIRRYEHVDK